VAAELDVVEEEGKRFLLDALAVAEAALVEVERSYRRAVQAVEDSLGRERDEVATPQRHLADVEDARRRRAEAARRVSSALTIRSAALRTGHSDIAADLAALATLLVSENRYEEPEPLLQRALITFDAFLGPESLEVAVVAHQLAQILGASGRGDEARWLYERSLGIRRRALDPGHLDVVTTLHNLALLYQAEGRAREAADLWAEASAMFATPPLEVGGNP
jgi:tetratricopeptide (TPR) repeat protein